MRDLEFALAAALATAAYAVVTSTIWPLYTRSAGKGVKLLGARRSPTKPSAWTRACPLGSTATCCHLLWSVASTALPRTGILGGRCSRENVELVHTAIDAFNRQDLAALADFCAEDFEFVSVLAAVDAGAPHISGPRGLERGTSRACATPAGGVVDRRFPGLRRRADSLAAVVRMTGRGQHSGVTVDRTIGMTYRLRDGKVSRMRVAYLEPHEALEAVGLSE